MSSRVKLGLHTQSAFASVPARTMTIREADDDTSASPRESTIVSAIMQALKYVPGLVVRKRWGTTMAVAGDPDLTGCYCGRHFELEVKAPDGRLSRIQEVRLKEWRQAGAMVAVVHSPEEALAILGISKTEATTVAPTIAARASMPA